MAEAGSNTRIDDARLWVSFYMGSAQNMKKSSDEGRPIFDEVPFVREASTLENLLDAKTRPGALDTKVASLVVPLGVQWIAKQTDTAATRKPIGLTQHIEANIPGLRQHVPSWRPKRGPGATQP